VRSDYKKNESGYRVLDYNEIILIDMGSAIKESSHHSTVITTRHYRPPEVILVRGWSYPADMYAVGCILVEFLTGEALYQTHETLEHLAMMERIMGKIPSHMTSEESLHSSVASYFRRGRLDWPTRSTTNESIAAVADCKRISDLLPSSTQEERDFLALIENLLSYEPHQRYTAAEALKHPFFTSHPSTVRKAPKEP
jgi:dual-specificity kinase